MIGTSAATLCLLAEHKREDTEASVQPTRPWATQTRPGPFFVVGGVMGIKNRVRHECLECATRWFPTRNEMTRAAGLKCPGCGSRFWKESQEGRKRLAEQQASVDENRMRLDREMGK